MKDNKDFSPFADDESNATQILQGLISPAPAQTLVAPPPDTPARSGPAESTPLTGNLRAAPSQATPKVAPAPANGKTRRGLAGYFSGGNSAAPDAANGEIAMVAVRMPDGSIRTGPKANLGAMQKRYGGKLKVIS